MSHTHYKVKEGVLSQHSLWRKMLAGAAALMLVLALVVSLSARAADTTEVVTGDTAAGENQPGWLFNRDPRTATSYEFNTDEASIGAGSLYAGPITNTNFNGVAPNPNWDKFIAENFLQKPVSELESISYDYLIAGTGKTAADSVQFYLNVYANLPTSDPNKFFDCRYDYVPVAGSGSTTDFTTASFSTTDTPKAVSGVGCPATLDGMVAGSVVRAFSINIGDTGASDTNLEGYLDNVVVSLTGGTTTYDFEPALSPTSKDACKNGGWASFNTPAFSNQGQCVAFVTANDNAKFKRQ